MIRAVTKAAAEGLYRRFAPFRRGIALTIYSGVAALAYTLAYLLRFELKWPEELTETFLLTLPVLLLIRIGTVVGFRLTLGRWRYVGVRDVARLVFGTTTGSAVFYGFLLFLPLTPRVPRSVVALEWIVTTYVTAGLWIAYRLAYEALRSRGHRHGSDRPTRKRALVVGAGEAGSHLVREMRRTPVSYVPVGIVDDDPLKWGTTLHGVEVIGAIDAIVPIASTCDADELIIALPSATPAELRGVVERCAVTGLPHKVLPGIAEVLEGRVSLKQLREVQVEDLLGREPVDLSLPELEGEFRGTTVLVTGAAGSIGSELARQIALNGPDTLVLLDQAESDLYFVDLDLQKECSDVDIVPVVGDVLDEWRLKSLFEEYRPDFVYHAAAYKHVPLMESNVREAIRNNVLGTWAVAREAAAFAVKKMVLVSTDKAVRPANVMGATKRVAELVVLACQERFPETWFTAVRFGNVLGSQGSVIPLFRRQLEAGDPLTVTHPEVTRYFMTVAEAVQLVLKASLVAEARGRIAMLEMGEPVRIMDLALNLLQLSGARADGQNGIEFTGLRPGEKLHEELKAPDEMAVDTGVEKIRVLKETEAIDRLGVLKEVHKWSETLIPCSDPSDVARVTHALWVLAGADSTAPCPLPASLQEVPAAGLNRSGLTEDS